MGPENTRRVRLDNVSATLKFEGVKDHKLRSTTRWEGLNTNELLRTRFFMDSKIFKINVYIKEYGMKTKVLNTIKGVTCLSWSGNRVSLLARIVLFDSFQWYVILVGLFVLVVSNILSVTSFPVMLDQDVI